MVVSVKGLLANSELLENLPVERRYLGDSLEVLATDHFPHSKLETLKKSPVVFPLSDEQWPEGLLPDSESPKSLPLKQHDDHELQSAPSQILVSKACLLVEAHDSHNIDPVLLKGWPVLLRKPS